VQVEDQASRAIYIRLRYRARVLRGLAFGFVVLIALTVAFGTIPYFFAGDMAVTESGAALAMRRSAAENAKSVEKRDRAAGETASGADAESAGTAAAPTRAPDRPGSAVSDEAFSAAVIRITAVFLLVALVFVFGSLYRYSMRLASYYDAKADALRLLEAGDRHLEERLAQITVPNVAGTGTQARRGERV
jgi:hypothetical protein